MSDGTLLDAIRQDVCEALQLGARLGADWHDVRAASPDAVHPRATRVDGGSNAAVQQLQELAELAWTRSGHQEVVVVRHENVREYSDSADLRCPPEDGFDSPS
jgi:hypothetical protein